MAWTPLKLQKVISVLTLLFFLLDLLELQTHLPRNRATSKEKEIRGITINALHQIVQSALSSRLFYGFAQRQFLISWLLTAETGFFLSFWFDFVDLCALTFYKVLESSVLMFLTLSPITILYQKSSV